MPSEDTFFIPPVTLSDAAAIAGSDSGDVQHLAPTQAPNSESISNTTRQLAYRDNLLADTVNSIIAVVNNREQLMTLPTVRALLPALTSEVVTNFRIPVGFECRIIDAAVAGTQPGAALEIFYSGGSFTASLVGQAVVSTASEFSGGTSFMPAGELAVNLLNNGGSASEISASIILSLRPVGAIAGNLIGPGPVGAAGPKGVQGDAGNTGPSGPSGPPGTPGLSFRGIWSSTAQYRQNDVVSYAQNGTQGYSAYVAAQDNVGDPPPAYGVTSNTAWNLLVQAGAQGSTGVLGPQGLQGPQGIGVGVPGPAGVAGPSGPQGLQGVQGPQGPIGNQGLAGNPGDYGFNYCGNWINTKVYKPRDLVNYTAGFSSISSGSISYGGFGYNPANAVYNTVLTGGANAGVGGTIQYQITSGTVVNLTITNGGAYTSAPGITFPVGINSAGTMPVSATSGASAIAKISGNRLFFSTGTIPAAAAPLTSNGAAWVEFFNAAPPATVTSQTVPASVLRGICIEGATTVPANTSSGSLGISIGGSGNYTPSNTYQINSNLGLNFGNNGDSNWSGVTGTYVTSASSLSVISATITNGGWGGTAMPYIPFLNEPGVIGGSFSVGSFLNGQSYSTVGALPNWPASNASELAYTGLDQFNTAGTYVLNMREIATSTGGSGYAILTGRAFFKWRGRLTLFLPSTATGATANWTINDITIDASEQKSPYYPPSGLKKSLTVSSPGGNVVHFDARTDSNVTAPIAGQTDIETIYADISIVGTKTL